ncbi:MAG: glycoside hydrolase domain-containing protein [Candidatus Firestonebacteria bacterium]
MKIFTYAIVLLGLISQGYCELSRDIINEIMAQSNDNERSTVRIQLKIGKLYIGEYEETEPAPSASAIDKERGFILFDRNYLEAIYPNSNPKKSEIKNEFSGISAQNMPSILNFSIYPLEDLGNVNASVDDFVSKEGGKISKANIDLRVGRYLGRGGSICYLKEGYTAKFPVLIKPGMARRVWLTVRVPAEAAPGYYETNVTLRTEKQKETRVKLVLKVLPIVMERKTDYSNGWFYGWWKDENELLEELTEMRKDGFNSAMAPAGTLTAKGMDFTALDKYYEAAKKAGMDGIHQVFNPGGMSGVAGSKEFTDKYEIFCRELFAWGEKHPDFKYTLWITDEPREIDDTGWNLNFKQTMSLLDAASSVKGLSKTITLVGDGSAETDYPGMVPKLEWLQTHHWKSSEKIITIARKLGTYWLYNSGVGRFEYGYHAWRTGAKGKFEWHYSWRQGDTFSPTYSQFAYVMRTPKNELVPSPSYLRSLEGSNDLFLLYMLEKKVAEGLRSDRADIKSAAARGEGYLKAMRVRVPDYIKTEMVTGAEAGNDNEPMKEMEQWRLELYRRLMAFNL